MMNTRLHYLYRDASNYKSWGEVVFAGPPGELVERLIATLEAGQFFIAHQVRIQECFVDGWPESADDHCFHEFESLEGTEASADDPHQRSIDDFVEEMERIGHRGWRVFDPAERSRFHPGVKCRS